MERQQDASGAIRTEHIKKKNDKSAPKTIDVEAVDIEHKVKIRVQPLYELAGRVRARARTSEEF
jgi:hypothetical protein